MAQNTDKPELQLQPVKYSSTVLKLRNKAKELGVSEYDINKCGNSQQCLENIISIKEEEIKKKNQLDDDNYSSMGFNR
ncbi:transcriptional regulator, MerR family [Arcobacter nitrofigilis DSM 7299]|uniref:Transcriptional regulator, MerR family n=1 Tax=Arcobacter nitrofigilis (strain ATCC 33309 / DSM 7299 / CCUG 15893 / LMG 7604 / NCTC 12251 / CI) TaxID=572480 RepID=D5V258_ARCNC|nr:hypothetical protein [Arcobacter nitrofigilis]ADG92291.1 transcriptional regulator, MerR family [Arcobacter nitrofigilis DSM 7299]